MQIRGGRKLLRNVRPYILQWRRLPACGSRGQEARAQRPPLHYLPFTVDCRLTTVYCTRKYVPPANRRARPLTSSSISVALTCAVSRPTRSVSWSTRSGCEPRVS